MIINLRAPGGGGKSTLAKTIANLYPRRHATFEDRPSGRRPAYYTCEGAPGAMRPLALIGPYDIPSGGCDALKVFDKIFNLIKDRHHAGMDVLYEGMLVRSIGRTVDLHRECDQQLLIAYLDTPVSVCHERIYARRKNQRRQNYTGEPKSVAELFKRAASECRRWEAEGIETLWLPHQDPAPTLARRMGLAVEGGIRLFTGTFDEPECVDGNDASVQGTLF